MEGGRCSLEAVEDVRGSFRRDRRPREAAPGMLTLRLIGQDGATVDEQTILAPDYRCVVLDPHVADGGPPQAARLTSDEASVFQVRFPQVQAVRLDVLRITAAVQGSPALAEQLLASFPLPGQ